MNNKLLLIWLLILSVLCVVEIVLIVYFMMPYLFVNTDIPIFIITLLTLIALIHYAYDTHEMVKSQHEKDLTPSIGFELISMRIDGIQGQNYYIAYDVNLELESYTPKETISRVYLDLFIDEIKVKPISDAYNGAPVWIITPHGKRLGHFIIDDNMVKSVNPDLVLSALSWNPTKKIEISIYYISEIIGGFSHTFSKFNYKLDLNSGKLILE